MHFRFIEVNHGFNFMVGHLKSEIKDNYNTRTSNSRNGPVVYYDEPMTCSYVRPQNRVLTHPVRDANPFFHVYEALWMLAGRNDVESVARFVKRMKDFSDDGKTLHGAYGYRWRKYFGYDQLDWIVDELAHNPETRRCVLQMWDGGQVHYDQGWNCGDCGNFQEPDDSPEAVEFSGDLYKATHGGKDVPCNTECLFLTHVRDGRRELDMTVFNRSNDTIWGALGANYVHFSVLLEYMAFRSEYQIGRMHVVSNNLHLYTDRFDPNDYAHTLSRCPYGADAVPHPMFDNYVFKHDQLERDIVRAAEDPYSTEKYIGDWFNNVFQPMMLAHEQHKLGETQKALSIASNEIIDVGWNRAATEWLQRRVKSKV